MIRLEQYKPDKHYELLETWWRGYDWEPVPKDGLPPSGFVAYKEDQPLAAGFLYDTDSPWALIEWIVGNPESKKQDRRDAVDKVMEGLIVIAELKGKKYIHSVTRHKGLIKTYTKHGFEEAAEVTELVRRL